MYWLLVFRAYDCKLCYYKYAPTTLIKQKPMLGIRQSLTIPYVHCYSLPKYIFKFVVLIMHRGKKVFFLILTCPPPNYYFSVLAPWYSSFTRYRTISMGTISMDIQKLDKTVLVSSSTTNARLRHLFLLIIIIILMNQAEASKLPELIKSKQVVWKGLLCSRWTLRDQDLHTIHQPLRWIQLGIIKKYYLCNQCYFLRRCFSTGHKGFFFLYQAGSSNSFYSPNYPWNAAQDD